MGIKKTQEEVARIFEERGCKVAKEYVNSKVPIEYICKCGTVRKQLIKDFLKKDCRTCISLITKKETVIPEGVEDTIDEQTGEVWKRVLGGWVSSFGRAKNLLGNELTLSSKGAYKINKKDQYVTRLVARAFQIPGYEKLGEKGYVVTHLDKNNNNNHVENLKVVHLSDIDHSNFKKLCLEKDVDVTGLEYKVISMFPNYKIYENGEIYNGKRFFKFGETTTEYLRICVSQNGKEKNYRVHRLVCFAFHPIEGLNELEDYNHLQVNHKDRNRSNNHKDNLEWVTSSENSSHAHQSGSHTKTRAVVQLEKGGTKILGEYYCIAEAVRKTDESYHSIHCFLNGKSSGTRKYDWKYSSNDDDIEEDLNIQDDETEEDQTEEDQTEK